ncbi:MAG: hypothetical protein ACFFAY_01370 [Promethearchaeota archaeon]
MSGVVNWSRRRKIQASLILAVVILLVPSFLIFYRVPSFVNIESLPVYFTDCTSEQHVVVYNSLISDENITIGEVGITWELSVFDENEDYRFYELDLFLFVSGAIGEGLIQSGSSLLELSTMNQSIYQCSEVHGEGAVETNLASNSSWGGDTQLFFRVLPGYEGFRPQSASNGITLTVVIKTHLEASIKVKITFTSSWVVETDGGLFFQGIEKLFIISRNDIF